VLGPTPSLFVTPSSSIPSQIFSEPSKSIKMDKLNFSVLKQLGVLKDNSEMVPPDDVEEDPKASFNPLTQVIL
jgi:hypothetical protein